MNQSASKGFNIAMVGQTNALILAGLCDALKLSDPDLTIAVYRRSDSGLSSTTGTQGVSGAIDKARQPYEGRITKLAKRFVGLRNHFEKDAEQVSGFPARSEPRWRPELRHLLGRFDSLLSWGAARSMWAQTDLLHVQGMFWEPAHDLLAYREPLKPMVVSLLGSDVLRQHQPGLVAAQQALLQKADIITTTGIELRETALAKYGRHLAEKFRQTYFPLDPAITAPILKGSRAEAKDRLRSDLRIGADSILVTVGHNGYPNNQHIPIIRAISELSSFQRARVHLLIPMTYGKSDAHLRNVSELAGSLEFEFTIFDEFMTEEEAARLRLATDILVFAPISDAFSASVSQALMAGSVVICGSWLPYTSRRRAGFRYWEIDQTSDLSKVLKSILAQWPKPLSECAQNPKLAECFFDQKRLGKQWRTAYADAVLARKQKTSS